MCWCRSLRRSTRWLAEVPAFERRFQISLPIPSLSFALRGAPTLPSPEGRENSVDEPPQVLEIIALPPRRDSADRCAARGSPPLPRNRCPTSVPPPHATAAGPRRPISMDTWLKG